MSNPTTSGDAQESGPGADGPGGRGRTRRGRTGRGETGRSGTLFGRGADHPVGDVVRRLILVGVPLALAVVMWIHPHSGEEVYANLAPVADTFLAAHLAAYVLFGGLAVGLTLLASGYPDGVATIARAGIAVYAAFYLGMVAVLGVGTGLLVRYGRGLPADQRAGVAEAVGALHADPLLFGAGVVGVVGYLVAVVAIAVVLRRRGAPTVPLALLIGSVVAIGGHSGIAGVAGMVLFAVAAAWLEFGWTPSEPTEAGRTG